MAFVCRKWCGVSGGPVLENQVPLSQGGDTLSSLPLSGSYCVFLQPGSLGSSLEGKMLASAAVASVISAETDPPGYFKRGDLVWGFGYASSRTEPPASPEAVTAGNSQHASSRLEIPGEGI